MLISSFDIFDTCIVRSCGSRELLWYVLAQDVVGEGENYEKLRDFVRARATAEHIANEKQHNDAVTLAEIYAEFEIKAYTSLTTDEVMKREIQLDAASWVPVASVKRQIEECRKKGRVIYVSDMYYSEQCLRQGLERLGLIKSEEKIYVSCEHRASKYTGQLFRYVQEQEGIAYNQWHHYGDNKHNDYIVPKQLGIQAHLLSDTASSECERLADDVSFFSEDKFSATCFGNILRSVRLQNTCNDGGFLSDVMCGTIIPFVVACLNDAQRRGLRRLYFASRDAYIMYLVAKEFLNEYPDIELRYLYLSTKVVYPLIIHQGIKDELRAIFRNISTFTPQKILDMLGFDAAQQDEIAQQMDIRTVITWDSPASDKLSAIILEPRWRGQLLANVEEKRVIFLDYLRQQKFLAEDASRVGLVDIGWRCSTQKVLASLLPHDIMYYYYGVSDDNFRYDEMGQYKAWYFMTQGRACNHRFFEGYICRNMENTLIGYQRGVDNLIVPIFAQGDVPEWLERDFQLRAAYLESCTKLVRQYPSVRKQMDQICTSYSQRLVERFSQLPPQQMCRFLADKLEWDHYTDKDRMIRKLRPSQYVALRFFRSSAKVKQRYHSCWLAASLSYTYGTNAIKRIQALEKRFSRWKRVLR